MSKLNENRTIHMYLPDDYLVSKKRYPVLYMFDGHNLFNDEDATYGKSWNLGNQIYWNKKDLIVVGQECSHQGNNRLDEYGPWPFADEYFGVFEGKGELTMHFFIEELKPYIDQHFPTLRQREYTWIGGSSCGGLMAYYAGVFHSSIYSKSLVISPYFLPTADYLLWNTSHTHVRHNTSMYMSWGAREGGKHSFVQETKICTDLATILQKKGVKIHFNVKPEGEHTESDWESEVPAFLDFLFEI